jgi:hypothetical protein
MSQPSFTAEMPDTEIAPIISETLPQFRAACDNPNADMVILHRSAFKNSTEDLLLMGMAIKYAGLVRKNVTICA